MLIGEFEVAAKHADPDAEPDQFKLNGELFTVSGKDLTITFGRFAKAATSGLDTAEMEGTARMIDMLTGVVVPEDAERMLETCDGLDPEKIFEVVAKIIEAQTGRPTEQPSDSSGGLSTTGENLKVQPSTQEEAYLAARRADPRFAAVEAEAHLSAV